MLSHTRIHLRETHRAAACLQLVALLAAILACTSTALAQDQKPPPTDVHEHVAVTAPLLTPTKEASGTAWLPEVTPMYGVHRPWRGWDLRLAGIAFVQAVYEPRDRHRTGGAQPANRKHQLGHVYGPPECGWRTLGYPNDVQRRTVDRL